MKKLFTLGLLFSFLAGVQAINCAATLTVGSDNVLQPNNQIEIDHGQINIKCVQEAFLWTGLALVGDRALQHYGLASANSSDIKNYAGVYALLFLYCQTSEIWEQIDEILKAQEAVAPQNR